MPPKKNPHTATNTPLAAPVTAPARSLKNAQPVTVASVPKITPVSAAPSSAPTPAPVTTAQALYDIQIRLDAVQKEVHKLNRKFFWFQMSGWIKLFIIFAPLIIGVVYLMPFLEQALDFYKTLLNDLAPISELSKNLPQGGAGAAGGMPLDQLIQSFLKGAR